MGRDDIFPDKLIFEKMYHYLWTSPIELDKPLILNLPHTILFKNSLPVFWYYSNKAGKIRKRKNENLNKENILNFLTKNVSKSGCVAYLIYPTSCE